MILIILALILLVYLFIMDRRVSNLNKIPKKIWSFWDGDIPPLIQKCMATWKKHCPDYEIKVFTKEDTQHIKQYKNAELNVQKWSDYVRLDVLEREGGVWLDASIWLNQSLDWIQTGHEYVGEYARGRTEMNNGITVVDSWFMACVPGCKFVKDVNDEFKRQSTDFDSLADYIKSIRDEGTIISGMWENPEYFSIHVAMLRCIQKNGMYPLRLIAEEDDAQIMGGGDGIMEAFCDKTYNDKIKMYKLTGYQRSVIDMDKCQQLKDS
jgi:hypothetical protein